MIGMHVDDGIGGGDIYFHEVLRKNAEIFPFGSYKEKDFKFTGIRFHQEADWSIKYDQTEYVQEIQPLNISRERRRDFKAEVTEEERTLLRGINGSLSYAGIHSRPELCAKIGRLQTEVNKATVGTLMAANKVLHEAKMYRNTFILVPALPVDQVTYCAFHDASFFKCRGTFVSRNIDFCHDQSTECK